MARLAQRVTNHDARCAAPRRTVYASAETVVSTYTCSRLVAIDSNSEKRAPAARAIINSQGVFPGARPSDRTAETVHSTPNSTISSASCWKG